VPQLKNQWLVASSHCKWRRRYVAVENGRISSSEGLVTLTLTFYRVILHRSCITQRPLPTRQISLKSKKLCGRTDGRTHIWNRFY